jgi:predicted short-subunit dehydrogenase-like oxidoreductase (DUF2520 family)
MLARSMKRSISILGAGRVGKALGKRLRELGWHVGAVVTRSPQSARAAVRAIGAGTSFAIVAKRRSSAGRRGAAMAFATIAKRRSPGGRSFSSDMSPASHSGVSTPEALSRAILSSDVILVATPDQNMAGIVRQLAEKGSDWRGKIVLHTSGTLDRSVLAPLARRGAHTGSMHPMQTFSGKNVPRLEGVTFAIEGDATAIRVAQSIARSLGGIPVKIAGRNKPAYHATGVLASGSCFALIESSLRILTSIGFTRRQALETLLPLIRQMLDNIERLGPRAAWTGPLSRGDYAVVAKHARALRRYPPEFGRAYTALAQLAGRVLAKNPREVKTKIDQAIRDSRR